MIGDDTLNNLAIPPSGFSATVSIGRTNNDTEDKGLDGWIDELVWYDIARVPGGAPVNFYSRTDALPINFYSLP